MDLPINQLVSELNGTQTEYFGDFINHTEYMNHPGTDIYNQILGKYVKPATFFIGIVSNVFLVCLILATKLGKESPMVYVAGIALVDIGYLCFGVFTWIQTYFEFAIYHTVGMCQLVNYGVKAFTFLTRWYLTALCAERFVWQVLPQRRSEFCDVFKTKIVLVGIAVVAMYSHVYICWFLEASEDTNFTCNVHPNNLQTFTTLLRIDMVLACLIPYAITFALTVCLVIKMLTGRGKQQNTESREIRTIDRMTRSHTKENKAEREKPLNATGICIGFSLSLLIFTTPANMKTFLGVMFSYFFIPYSWTPFLDAILEIHFAVKPVICFIVSPQMRHSFCQLVRCVCKRVVTRGNSRSNTISMREVNVEESPNIAFLPSGPKDDVLS